MDEDRVDELYRLLVETGRAHHAATGGPNPQWAQWYAEYLHGRIDMHLQSKPSVETLTAWLVSADEEYRREDRDESWPRWYARYFLEELDSA